MTWYAYGEFVLDQLLQVDRCDEVLVYVTAGDPEWREIRQTLGLRDDQRLSGTTVAPRMVVSLDCLVVGPDGSVRDVESGMAVVALPSVDLIDGVLEPVDALRLARWQTRYPELDIPESLLR